MKIGEPEVNGAGTVFRTTVGLAAIIEIGAVFVPLQRALLVIASAHPDASAVPIALPLAGGALVAFAVGYAPMIRGMRAEEREVRVGAALRRMIPAFMVAGALVAAMMLPVTALILDSVRDTRAASLARP
ncbi:hypothetical protein EON77_02345 [bacterium]|nr:MAG: hypothetical protein EON77_02345 [bacterium]